MLEISFGAPTLLPLLGLALLAAGGVGWSVRQQRRAEARYRGTGRSTLRAAGTSARRQRVKAAAAVAGIALIALAAARPQVGTKKMLLQKEGSDVLFALDVSLSMSAQDAPPSRLGRAKAAITALLSHLGGDRVGLVVFAGSADLRFPLTTDLEAARQVVQGVSFKDGGLEPGTSIGGALREASSGFADDKTRSKVLVLVSDGEDLGDDGAAAAAFVHSAGIALDTIGVGKPAPVPVLLTDPRTGQARPALDPQTQAPLLTTADPVALQQLAVNNGGHFYDGNNDDVALRLADEVERLQKTPFESGQGAVPIERFQWLAGLALLLVLGRYLLGERRGQPVRRRGWVLLPRLVTGRRQAIPIARPGSGD
jgi:Ca-activated chloride channel family protein